MKSMRHSKILEIVSKNSIETQDELLTLLRAEGYKATQATISRDIKDLRLIKALGPDGKYRYIAASSVSADLRSNFTRMFSQSVVSVGRAQNMVIIKTLSGMANALCAAIDAGENSAIVGTIAGDDTIFIACAETEDALVIAEEYKKLLKQAL